MRGMFDHLTAEQQRTLHERAQALSSVEDPASSTDEDLISVAILELPPERYGVAIQQISDIEPLRDVTQIPGLDKHWRGVVNLRGSMYAVLDLRVYLGLSAPMDAPAKPKIVRVRAANMEVGLLVDAVEEIEKVALNALTRPPRDKGAGHGDAVRGVTPDLLTVLDLDQLLSDPRLIVGSEEGA